MNNNETEEECLNVLMKEVDEGKNVFKPSSCNHDDLEDILIKLAIRKDLANKEYTKWQASFYRLKIFQSNVKAKCTPLTGKAYERDSLSEQHQDYINHLSGMADAYEKMIKTQAIFCNEADRYEAIKSILLKRYGSSK